MTNSSSPAPQIYNELERKFLPATKVQLPKLINGAQIFQFYLPAEKLIIIGNTLCYLHTKNPLLELSTQEIALVKILLAWPKTPKPRIRISEKGQELKAYLTIKADSEFGTINFPDQNPVFAQPLSNQLPEQLFMLEFERLISTEIAQKLLYKIGGQTQRVIAKTRYLVNSAFSHPFEIDVFQGPNSFITTDRKILDNSGLIIIELETDQNEIIADTSLPAWVGQEVTQDKRYANTRLSLTPFSKWPENQPKIVVPPFSFTGTIKLVKKSKKS